MPAALAGHGGGAIKGNLHLKAPDGTPMANAMLSVLQTLGVEVDSFGDSSAALDLNAAGSTTAAELVAGGWLLDARCSAAFRAAAGRHICEPRLAGQSRRWCCPRSCYAAAEGPAAVADAAMARRRRRRPRLLKQGGDVNAAQGDGMTALHWAAMHGDAALAETLLYAGGNVRATTRLGGYTPLHLASQTGTRAVVDALVGARRRRQRAAPRPARRR